MKTKILKERILRQRVIRVTIGYKSNDEKIYPLNSQSMMLIWGAKTSTVDNHFIHKDDDRKGWYFYIKDLKDRYIQLKAKKMELDSSVEILSQILKEVE